MEWGRGYLVKDSLAPFPSMTTVLKDYNHEDIDKWRAIVGEEEANATTKRATDKGSAVHALLEKYIGNDPDLDLNQDYTVIDGFKSIKAIVDAHVDNVYHQETTLYSLLWRIAGTVDLIAEYDGLLSIIDFKTSAKTKYPDMITNYLIQETGYKEMYQELTGNKIEQLVTIIATEFDQPQVFIEKPETYMPDLAKARGAFYKKYGV